MQEQKKKPGKACDGGPIKSRYLFWYCPLRLIGRWDWEPWVDEKTILR